MELSIAKHLVGQLPRLKNNEELFTNWETTNPYNPKFHVLDKNTFLGLELEIESIPNPRLINPYWMITKDGSLRNNGVEFVSHPLKAHRVEQALTSLFSEITDYEYSDRCSIHVHMNVRTLTLSQLESLVLTYMVFEKALFNWVGNNRENNIFCVPLNEVTITKNFCNNIKNLQFKWSKYTALNILPITSKGSIEFRHMYGTNSIKIILDWINFLIALKVYALRVSPDVIKNQILNLNTTSNYRLFGEDVFGPKFNLLLYPELDKDMSYCISNIKATCLSDNKEPQYCLKLTKFLGET